MTSDFMAECEGLLLINKNNLDEELIHQPEVYHRVANEYALAVSRKDESKYELELAEADADQRIRLELAADNEKVTEPIVAKRVSLDAEVHNKTLEYLSSKELSERWKALVDSFGQRAYALRDLTSLYISGYFGEVVGNGERTAAKTRKGDEARKATADERRRQKAVNTS